MALNLSDYLKMLTEPSYHPKARLTFLRMEDESPYDIITGDILDGNIQITRNNGVRRSCSLTLKNDDGKYIPNPYNIWVNRKFFLELGLEKETYVDQTVWENDPEGEETKEAGRFDNTVAELQEGTLTNVFVDSNGLQLVANEPVGNRISPIVSLSEIKNVDSSLIEWVATTPQGTVGEEVLTQSNFEEGTLTDVAYDTDGIKLNLPITEGNWLSPTLDLSPIKKAISSSVNWEADEQEQTAQTIENTEVAFNEGTLIDVVSTPDGLKLENTGVFAETGNRTNTMDLNPIKNVVISMVSWIADTPSSTNQLNETEISTGVFDQTEHNLGVITLQYGATWEILSGLTWEEV